MKQTPFKCSTFRNDALFETVSFKATSSVAPREALKIESYASEPKVFKSLGEGHLSAPLFCVAWIAKSLSKKINCYQKYGLPSSLASCSATLSTRKTYIATTVECPVTATNFFQTNKVCSETEGFQQKPVAWSTNKVSQSTSRLLTATSLWKKECSVENFEGAKVSIDSLLSSTSYVVAETFENGISFHKTPKIEDLAVNNLGNLEGEASGDTTIFTKISAFKVSRDYISSDSSEGFEDWSFLDQKRPYDSLVRENIYELLEDLENSKAMTSEPRVLEKSLRDSEEVRSGDYETSAMNTTNDGLEEHLFSSEIQNTYANRLRLEQRMKHFYGFTSLTTKLVKASNAKSKKLQKSTRNFHFGSQSVWDILLQLEERIDIHLFRLNWVSSLAHARQVLKHKHIGILDRKDRQITGWIKGYAFGSEAKIEDLNEASKQPQYEYLSTESPYQEDARRGCEESFSSIAAASNLFLKEGDLLYWREKNKSVLGYQFSADSNTSCLGGMKTLGSHKFPWFGYINDSDYGNTSYSDRIPAGSDSLYVFALGSSHGSINLSDDIALAFTRPISTACSVQMQPASAPNASRSEEVSLLGGQQGKRCGRLPKKQASVMAAASLQKLSQYFETHYKYTYAIRTAQDLKLEYLRLPQSSIQKNEWKAFLESSI
jgi:hypothetical protein